MQIGDAVELQKDITHFNEKFYAGEIGVVTVVDRFRMYCDVSFIGHLHKQNFDVNDMRVISRQELANVSDYYR